MADSQGDVVPVDNGSGQPYDILELGLDVGPIDEVVDTLTAPENLDNSGSSEPPEKGDSGIEDKDSHPNSPTTEKVAVLNGTMTCDVREKIAKNRTASKTVEQIRTERQRANKGKSNRGTKPKGGTKNPPQQAKQANVPRGMPSRRRGAVRGRGGKIPPMTRFSPNQSRAFSHTQKPGGANESMNQSMFNSWGRGTGGKWNLNGTVNQRKGKPTQKKKTQFDLENSIIIPSTLNSTWQEFRTAPLDSSYQSDNYPTALNESMYRSMHEGWGAPKGKMWNFDETRLSGNSKKNGTWTSPPRFLGRTLFSRNQTAIFGFDNLKVTVRRGKYGGYRKVESPEIKKKLKASKEIMGLIKGTNQRPYQSTSEDKENAGKHILAILQGKGGEEAPKRPPPKIEINKFKQVLEECIHIPSTLNTTWQEFRNPANEQTLDLSEVPDEPEDEGDSIATTVKSCILKKSGNTPIKSFAAPIKSLFGLVDHKPLANLQISES